MNASRSVAGAGVAVCARGAIDAETRPAARMNRRTAGFIRSLRGAKTRPGWARFRPC